MRRRAVIWTWILSMASCSAAYAGDGRVRALFVAVDKYQFSKTHVPSAKFKDLRGAVRDAGLIKDALRGAYGFELDRIGPDGGCRSSNELSTTLTDACATRAAILAGIDELVDRSTSGDTILFYFAGHGGRIVDSLEQDQASGSNSTILPHDARDPEAPTRGDILDRELRDRIDRASARGVNVVTIFDSCHSGTATRADPGIGEPRFAPELKMDRGDRTHKRSAIPWWSGGGRGYRVHLAAARDDEEAREVPVGPDAEGARAGVFTTALAATLLAMPDATFDDIMVETRRAVESGGQSRQHPQAEGALDTRLRGGGVRAVLYAAEPTPEGATLAAGSLSGVTQGSVFALFADSTTATAPEASPITNGVVRSVEASVASLGIDSATVTPLPTRLVARKTLHAFGDIDLRIRNAVPRNAGGTAVDAALAALAPLARIADPPQLLVSRHGKGVALKTADAEPIADLGDPREPTFPSLLADAVRKYAHVQALLGLRSDPASSAATFCIDHDLDYDLLSCPPPEGRGPRTLTVDRKAKLSLVNTDRARAPRHLYLFGIDPSLGVTVLWPTGGGVDPPLPWKRAVQRTIAANTAGRYRFVTIATDAPINAAALQQDGTGVRDPAACTSPLERLLCAASAGTRDPSVPRVGAWTATVTEVNVR
jgi:hypothetical protein